MHLKSSSTGSDVHYSTALILSTGAEASGRAEQSSDSRQVPSAGGA